MSNFQELRKKVGRRITDPVVPLISRLKLTPDLMTLIGLIINLVAATIIGSGHLFLGGIIFLLAGLFDMLDGALARYMQETTKFGAIFDSTADRLTEGAFFLSFIFITSPATWPYNTTYQLVLIFTAMIGSFLTSYIRARAEGLSIECTVGLFTRVERVIILAAGLLVNQLFIALTIVAIFSFVTAGQRFIHVWHQTRKQ